MEIKGKVHCFFEQSGTFKNAFKRVGIPAEDYDIQNNFGETDHVMDLFAEIDSAYRGGQSVFDGITKDDLIVAFYPCIYFSCMSAMNFSMTAHNYRRLPVRKIAENILDRSAKRSEFFDRLNRFCFVCIERGLRMVFENPWSENHYLKSGFIQPPSVVDMDRSKRGDFRTKPTAYWFFNCEPTNGFTYEPYRGEIKRHMSMSKGAKAGLCSEERSLIHPNYAKNWINDFILGTSKKEVTQCTFI